MNKWKNFALVTHFSELLLKLQFYWKVYVATLPPTMKKSLLAVFTACIFTTSFGQQATNPDTELRDKAVKWVDSLHLTDAAKKARVQEVIVTHLTAVRDWHNNHPTSEVPSGINPVTGKMLSDLDKQVIICSAKPASVHEALMTGLRKDLDSTQVETILDGYTIGKVAFTLKGYKAIVRDLTAQEEAVILGNLKLAREQAVDYKSMKEISAIFEIYKTQCENYLNSNGRNWKQLFSSYVKAAKAKKAAEQGKN